MRVSKLPAALLAVAVLLVPACEPAALTPPKGPPATSPSPVGKPTPSFVEDLRLQLARELNLPLDAVLTSEVQAVEWPDACLGAARANEMCLQVITPGYRLFYSTPQGDVEIHTDEAGEVYRRVEPIQTPMPKNLQIVVVWERSGGIAGICQRLVIDSRGGYRLQDGCVGAAQSTGLVPAEATAQIERWREEYAPFIWQSIPPTGSADMFTEKLAFSGMGVQTASETDQGKIADFLGLLVAELMSDAQPTPGLGDSGIAGEVVIGPTCPVVAAENPCPDRPYQATITVLASTGEIVSRIVSQADGTFRLSLAPGTYILQGESDGSYPRAPRVEVTVEGGNYTQVTLAYDTGIR